ncbi:glycoside hydrolase family 108 protein [Methylovirgula sp. 4M-Z18]|uniref:glycoside hydrolase family 108 protein n=1 Tax=Methylovirgula sp. 4M-Z18 TaxID=2293567 RepID=UPI000E2FC2FF|nr:glycosyl hydrolase 108 family protein [Methylovirgula sp. 4M-Z18]RFB80037.1 hypothetical protein DYH55_00340 [Methylovirgula sp. 4M-Z18]
MAVDNFANCLAFTLKYEGAFVDNPHDPGGPTCCGITQATLSHELGRKASLAEVRALQPQSGLVKNIYIKKYWNLIDGDRLAEGVDLMAFDIAVNMGPGRALRWLAQTVSLNPSARVRRLHAVRLGFWKRLKIWAHFGRGWTAREVACERLALTMATAPVLAPAL